MFTEMKISYLTHYVTHSVLNLQSVPNISIPAMVQFRKTQ